MQVSISEAARMVGIKSRTTMYRHIKRKGISVIKDENNNPAIDVSELARVYGDKLKLPEKNGTREVSHQVNTRSAKQPETQIPPESASGVKYETLLEEKLRSSQKTVELLERQYTQMEEQLSKSQKQLEKTQDQLDKALEIGAPITKLIEDQREGQGGKQKETEEKLRRLEKTTEQQDELIRSFLQKDEQRRLRAQERRKKQEEERQRLEEEQGRGLFSKLFSSRKSA